MARSNERSIPGIPGPDGSQRCVVRRSGVLEHLTNLTKILHAVRALLLLPGAAALSLAFIPQAREIYRALAEEPMPNLCPLVFLVLLLPTLCAAFVSAAGELLSERFVPRTPELLVAMLPRLLGALIPAGMSVGLFLAASEIQIETIPSEAMIAIPTIRALMDVLHASSLRLMTAAAVCVALIAIILFPSMSYALFPVLKRLPRQRLRISHLALLWIVCLIFLCLFPVRVSQTIGPISIVLLATACTTGVAMWLTRLGDRLELPILSSVGLLALLLSVFDLTDNHHVELADTSIKALERSSDVFEKWYQSRLDRKFYEQRGIPYPVFLIAASGGGLYAAHHTATVLARLQDQCPTFAQHIFAISGVSGGSLGAALYSSLAKFQARNQEYVACSSGPASQIVGHFEQQVDSFLESDMLSPLLGAALFPDAIQRFIPIVVPRFDRARQFDDSLAQAWHKLGLKIGGEVWTKPFLNHWDPTGVAPALVFNTTSVEHGYRVVITPFSIIDMGELGNIVALSNLAEFHNAIAKRGSGSASRLRDVTLAAAVSLSARFPWVLPAGTIESVDGSIRIVDGGYVDNSGAETVFDLLQSLGRYYGRENTMRKHLARVQLHVIAITNVQILESTASSLGLGELLSPVRAMLSTRETRAMAALKVMGTSIEQCSTNPECAGGLALTSFSLNLHDLPLPLGWTVSPSTKAIVKLHSGVASRAGTYLGGSSPDGKNKPQRFGGFIASNDSAACQVIASLQGTVDRHCP